jgi:hypothetical protein
MNNISIICWHSRKLLLVKIDVNQFFLDVCNLIEPCFLYEYDISYQVVFDLATWSPACSATSSLSFVAKTSLHTFLDWLSVKNTRCTTNRCYVQVRLIFFLFVWVFRLFYFLLFFYLWLLFRKHN